MFGLAVNLAKSLWHREFVKLCAHVIMPNSIVGKYL